MPHDAIEKGERMNGSAFFRKKNNIEKKQKRNKSDGGAPLKRNKSDGGAPLKRNKSHRKSPLKRNKSHRKYPLKRNNSHPRGGGYPRGGSRGAPISAPLWPGLFFCGPRRSAFLFFVFCSPISFWGIIKGGGKMPPPLILKKRKKIILSLLEKIFHLI